jgi:putative phosphoribosyl transferase
MIFRDRAQAGQLLAERLQTLAERHPIVAALPRGGLPVALRIAQVLEAPIDVIIVRKLGVPFQHELAMGALGEDGVRIVDAVLVAALGVSANELESVERRERVELERRVRQYRRAADRLSLTGRTVIIVDDGVATGSTACAAAKVAHAHGASSVILAVPVAPAGFADRCTDSIEEIDEVVVLQEPEVFSAVGEWYDDFGQIADRDALAMLRNGRSKTMRPVSGGQDTPVLGSEEPIPHSIDLGDVVLQGQLTVPQQALGVVVFAHGSGSGRHSPRNRYVAERLNRAHFATVLFDLLTEVEELDRNLVFDVDLLAVRLAGVRSWLTSQPTVAGLRVGYFGASTGAAAALCAAADDHGVAAVVSRGGRPDLAQDSLDRVTAPTMLIVGGDDQVVLDLNRRAMMGLAGERRLVVVPGAGHLFAEPGALADVADLAVQWFTTYL